MLKKSTSGVLVSLRGSTYRSVRLASSLAAALLDGLFEHPTRDGRERRDSRNHGLRVALVAPVSRFTRHRLGAAAFRTKGGFFCCLILFSGQGEELFALVAGANFEVGGSLVVDVGGQEQLQRVISDRAAVGEFDDGQAVVKDLEGSFLPFSGQYMPEDEHRLSLTFRAEVS